LGTPEERKLEPKDEKRLESVIPWNVVQYNTARKTFQKVEEAEHNPVCEPLDVILRRGRLKGLERQIGWESPAEQVGDGGSEGIEQMQEDGQSSTANNKISFWDLSSLLEVHKHRILGELLVEPIVITNGSSLGLDKGRVLLDVLNRVSHSVGKCQGKRNVQVRKRESRK